MLAFSQWLSTTALSLTIQKTEWIIPVIQIVHIVAISMVLTTVGMITGQILGVVGRTQTMTQTARRFLPWPWTGLILLTPTGAVLIIAEPQRTLDSNPAFIAKMLLLVIAIATTFWFQSSVRHNPGFWDNRGPTSATTKALAVCSVFVWVGIAVAGRWVAYLYHS